MRLVVFLDTLFKVANTLLVSLVATGTVQYTGFLRTDRLTQTASPPP